ncbi:MAG TPA: carbohydrate ABC transporter permease [Cellulomonas sp.]
MTTAIGTRRQRLNLPATIVLAVGMIYTILPVVWILIASTKTSGELFSTPAMVPSFGGGFAKNLHELFTYGNGIFLEWARNSVIYAVGGGVLSTVIAAAAGYALGKYQFRGSTLIFRVIVAGIMLPAVALAIPQWLLLSRVSLTNNYLSVILPVLVSPYAIYLCKIYAEASIAPELIEAARIDGASEWRIFHAVGLRLMFPALVTVFLLQFIGIWNNFLLPSIMLSNPHLYPLTMGLSGMLRVSGGQAALYSTVIMGSLVAIIPVVILFLALQRFWKIDLISGGVKS